MPPDASSKATSTPWPDSNWHAATREQAQLVELVRDLIIVYEGLHGGPPTLAWLLKEIGLAR